eukprot:1160536-Pelagomonas_calceolata.AAC.2
MPASSNALSCRGLIGAMAIAKDCEGMSFQLEVMRTPYMPCWNAWITRAAVRCPATLSSYCKSKCCTMVDISRTKTENFSAILEAEPEATKLAIANIFLLFCGFALSLVVISCDTAKCKDAGNIGQLLVGFAALLLACVEGYMQFLVASPSGIGFVAYVLFTGCRRCRMTCPSPLHGDAISHCFCTAACVLHRLSMPVEHVSATSKGKEKKG